MGTDSTSIEIDELRRHVAVLKDDGMTDADAHAWQLARQTLADNAERLLDAIEELREENKTLAQQYEAMCDHASALLNERDDLRRELGY